MSLSLIMRGIYPQLSQETMRLIHPSAWSSTLAIWPYDAPHRVGITRSPLGLFACRGGRPTRKKSLDTKGVVFAGAL